MVWRNVVAQLDAAGMSVTNLVKSPRFCHPESLPYSIVRYAKRYLGRIARQ